MTHPDAIRNPQPPTDDAPPHRYTAQLARAIESKWQDRWERERTFAAPNPGEPGFDGSRPKQYVLDMFPYPSGVGLHVGHPLGYIATDVYARYLRMRGFNVLHAMGFDAFGLPAEEYARETGTHPRITTERNMATMRAQMRRLGLAHDARRGVATIDPAYYKWTQWIFLKIYNSWYDGHAGRARPIEELIRAFESGAMPTRSGRAWATLGEDERREEIDARRLAYLAEAPVNWCPRLGTVLANEEVTADGRSERGNHPVFRRPMKQWMMRITAYAERLSADLDLVDWPESVKLMQRNWIGRSEGAFIDFEAATRSGSRRSIRVFTTRPDTIFGATYMVLSPEHPLVDEIAGDSWGAGTPVPWRGSFPGAPAGGLATPREAIASYRRYVQTRSDVQRTEAREKTGVFTGCHATNPATGESIPVFIADYVLMGYGTGAIMAVPGGDERDFEFAQKFRLPVEWVCVPESDVEPPDCFVVEGPARPVSEVERAAWDARYGLTAVAEPTADNPRQRYGFRGHNGAQRFAREVLGDARARITMELWGGVARPFPGEGVMRRSSNAEVSLDGMRSAEARRAIVKWLASRGYAEATVTYRLRDWLFSRQRYWGEPFPIVYDERRVPHDLPESMLPVVLPDLADFSPTSSDDPDAPPTPPLGRAMDWVTVELDLGSGRRRYRRETNTMPNWAGSCWYYLRYLDPSNDRAFCDPAVERYWMGGGAGGSSGAAGGVDLYVGGVEHAVLHLLYARFWHKILFDLGHVSTPEPFRKLFNQGYIQAAAYRDERGAYVEASEVEERGGEFFHKGRRVTREFGKMGKSLKNAVAPDDVCAEFGCDTLRVYEMSMGPLEASKPWNPRDIVGSYRLLQRVWRNLVDEQTGVSRVIDRDPDAATRRLMHKTILGVRQDLDRLAFNTPIAKLTVFNDALKSEDGVPRAAARALVLMLAPYAPHAAEELWERCGLGAGSLACEPFPEADSSLAADEEIELPVSVNGKVRGHIRVPPDADAKAIEAAALAEAKVIEHTAGKTIRKVILVPRKMVNVVVG